MFYRRGLWPNLMKLVDAELRFARSDIERADLLTEKGLVLADKLTQPVEARAAFEQAAQLDPTALTPLIQLERLALIAGDEAALADVWAKLAAASRRPERKLVHLLDLIRLSTDAGGEAIERARDLVSEAVALGVDGERVAVERLRVAELSGDPEEVLAALEAQAALLLARCGPAGAPEVPPHARAPGTPLDRPTALRLRLVAVRRRQAQTARDRRAGRPRLGLPAAGAGAGAGRAAPARRPRRSRRGAGPLRRAGRAGRELAGDGGRSGAGDERCRSGAPTRCCAAASATRPGR